MLLAYVYAKKKGMNIINGSIEDIAVYGTCRFYENVGFAYENPKKKLLNNKPTHRARGIWWPA